MNVHFITFRAAVEEVRKLHTSGHDVPTAASECADRCGVWRERSSVLPH